MIILPDPVEKDSIDPFYEPDDYDGLDIETAMVQEMRLQNGDY